MRNITLLFIAALFTTAANAQPDSLWSRTFGERRIDRCSSIIQTEDGGYALAGFTSSFGVGGQDIWLLKTDAEGDSLWSRTFGGERSEYCLSIIQTYDGGFALAGFTNSFGAGSGDMWLVKTNADGDSLWSNTYGGEHVDECRSIIQTLDSCFVLAGWTDAVGDRGRDMILVKTNPDGEILWSRTFGDRWEEKCYSVIQTTDGGYLLAGHTCSFGVAGDMWLVKTNENGFPVWSQTIGGDNSDYCYSVIQTNDGGYALIGCTGNDRFRFVKVNVDGDSLWSQLYNGGENGQFTSIIQTKDGGYSLAGHTNSIGAGQSDFWFVRTDNEGDSIYSKTFGGEDFDWCFSMILDNNGSYALGGQTNSFGNGDGDMWFVKTTMDILSWLPLPDTGFVQDSLLTLDLAFFYDYISPSIETDTLLVITIENGDHAQGNINNNELIITSDDDWFGLDSLLINVSEVRNEDNRDSTYLHLIVTEFNVIEEPSLSKVPREFAMNKAFPNPFNSTTNICFDLPYNSNVSINICDLSGRSVTKLFDDRLNAGRHNLMWDAGDYPAGVYLCTMQAGEFSMTEKLLLLK